jgi:hypothetical protein
VRWFSRSRPRLHLGHTGPPFLRLPYILGGREVNTHRHVMGLTGQGKSKLLAAIFVQLYTQGVPCALIDPHADLAHDVLAALHDRGTFADANGYRRLLYVDFGRQDAYLPFNVLSQPYEDHAVALTIAEACKRAWSALADGAAPQFENILLSSALVLIQNKLPLTAMPRLLTDKRYRDELLTKVTDPQIVHFFQARFDQWGKDAPLMIESTLRRIFLLTFSPTLRYSLGQEHNALDFRAHMDRGVSVVYNLGGLDEDTQRFLGCLLTVGYEVAALSRADLPEERRAPYHLITDEFSMFSAQSEEALARVLSSARKYGLFLTLAHQTWSQLSSRLQGALQNTVAIAFKLGRADAEWAAPRFGSFEAGAVKHVVEDPHQVGRTHPVFASLPEQWEAWTKALEQLNPREAFVKVGTHTAKIRTVRVPKPRCSRAELATIMERYRQSLMTPATSAVPGVDQAVAWPQRRPSARREPL